MSAGNLTLTVAQFRALGSGVLPASATVTLSDTGAAIASLSVAEMASLAAKGIDRIDSTNDQLSLSVAQYQALGSVTLKSTDTVVLADLGSILATLTPAQIAALAARGIDRIDATDDQLSLTAAQFLALGKVVLTETDQVELADTGAALDALSASQLRTLDGKGIDRINSTDGMLTLTVSELRAVEAITLAGDDRIVLRDTGSALAGLTVAELARLAGRGIDAIDSTTGKLTLGLAAYRALGTVTLTAEDVVTLRDTAATLSSLAATEIAALAAGGIDVIDASHSPLLLSVAQLRALGSVALTASDSISLADTGAALAGLTASEIAGLAGRGIDRLDATDGQLSLTVAQFQALGAVRLTATDGVTLADAGTAIGGLSAAALGALAGKGIDMIDATDNVLPLSFEQYRALGRLILGNEDALYLTGSTGDDRIGLRDRLSADDRIEGGDGKDTVVLRGDYGDGVVFEDGTLRNVEELQLRNGYDYDLTLADGTVAVGESLTVRAGLDAQHRLVLDGSAEQDGRLVVRGGAGDDSVTGGAGTDDLHGGDGNDLLAGGDGSDVVRGGLGNDRVDGGAGDDLVGGGWGDDVVDGGAGSDRVYGGRGNDVAVWHGAENGGAHDAYRGGLDTDTLRLDLTAAQYGSAATQGELAAYRAILSGPNPGHSFTFASLGLTVSEFETLDVLVDGQPPVTNHAPVAVADDNTGDAVVEAGGDGPGDTTASGNLLANDQDPDASDTLAVTGVAAGSGGPVTDGVGAVVAGTYGTITVAADGSYTYTLDNDLAATQALAAGEAAVDTFTYTIRDVVGAQSTSSLSIVVTGANDAAVISGTVGAPVTEDGVATVGGDLDATDVDSSAAFVAQTGAVATYGTFSIDADGAWTYTLDDANPAVDGLIAGDTLQDQVTVVTADGTAQVLTITIHGANDAAVITGTAFGAVTEDGGMAVGGDLDAIDVDSAAAFVARTGVAATYGTFSIDADGAWTYTLDNANPAIDRLNAGDTLQDQIAVTTADGTPQVVAITIHGANDAAVITGTASGAVTEDGGATVGGDLDTTDVDSSAAFMAQTGAVATYGTFSIDADGAWTYTLDNANPAVSGLNAGDTLQDQVTVQTADGTSQAVSITIHGVNDAAVIAGTALGSVTEDGGMTVGGDLDAVDVDSAAAFVARTGVAATYGTFSIDADGTWSYALDNANPAVNALNVGGSLLDQVTVATADGTTQEIDITINGANDAAVITGSATGGSVIVASRPADGGAADGESYGPSISGDGRHVGFISSAENLVTGDTNLRLDAFVKDTLTGTISRVSVGSAGEQGNADSFAPVLSADGRFASFSSDASNLVDGDTNGAQDVFVRDLLTGTTTRVSVANDGAQGNGQSAGSAISADGRHVVFVSDASNLVEGDTNGTFDVFVRDLELGTTTRVSVGSTGQQSAGASSSQSISADGRFVAFVGIADDLVAGDGNGAPDVFLRDTLLGTTALVAVDSTGAQGAEGSYMPSLSADGRYVAFYTDAALVADDHNGATDVYVRDMLTGTTTRASVDAAGNEGNGNSYGSISADGRYVAFSSDATNLVPDDLNGATDIFVKDLATGSVTRLSNNGAGAAGNAFSSDPAISADGSVVAFDSFASDLVANDSNGLIDVFVARLQGGGGDPALPTAFENGASISGDFDATDVDSLPDFVIQNAVATSYGSFSIDAAGTWTYTLDNGNPAVDGLAAGEFLHDLVTISTADGTTQVIDVTIQGTNDAAVIAGTASASVTENGPATVGGELDVSDVDGPPTFVEQVGAAASYGSFSIDATGTWSYTLDNANPAVDGLNAGDSLEDHFTVMTADGTSRVVTITINGANDAPVVSGAVTETATEDGATRTLSALANASDVDSGTALSVVDVPASLPAGVSYDAGTGTFTLDPSDAAYQSLAAGQTTTVSVSYAVSDGIDTTPASVSWTVTGSNDAPVVGGPVTGTATEDGTLRSLSAFAGVSDIDSGATLSVVGVPASLPAGVTYLAATGEFRLDPTNAAYQSLAAGQTTTVTVSYGISDGIATTPHWVSWTLTGTNDAPVVSGAVTGTATEDGAPRTMSALANATDVDSGATLSVVNVPASLPAGVSYDAVAGTFTLDPSNAAYQSLAAGQTTTVSVSYGVSDGTTTTPASASWTVTGTNDAAVITGSAAGAVTEDGPPTVGGDLNASDIDGAATFAVQSGVATAYGSFSVDAAGTWSYTLDNANATVNGLQTGAMLHDLIPVTTADGTVQTIDITINGTSDNRIDLTTLASTAGFVIQGDAANDVAGESVSSAGDLNGDGYADLIVGVPGGDDGGVDAGEMYVVFGKASGFGTVDATGRSVIDLTTLGSTTGFVIQGDAAGDLAGRSASSAGDLNGDGYADLIVGAPAGDDGGTNAGEAYVVFGKAAGFGTVNATGRSVVDLTTLGSTAGFVIQGDTGGDFAGTSVSSAGDLNGDGYADLIVGASLGDDGGADAGEAYVVFGKASGFGTVDATGRSVIDLTTLGSTAGFVIQGDTAGDFAGRSVSSAGDLNGDGYADLIVGAPGGGDGGTAAGEAYVVFGKASGFGTVNATGRSVIDLTTLGSTAGFVIKGDTEGDQAGTSVSSAGDLNGDGFADLIVGAPYGDDGGPSAGEAYVVFGKASGFGTVDGTGRSVIDLTTLASTAGFVIQGDTANDQAGTSVSSAGDLNGDGYADLIVGTPTGDDGGTNAGEAYVVFGKASGFGTVDATGRSVVDLTTLASTSGLVIQGDTASDFAGISVSSAGDLNGDGYADLIVGTPYGDDGGSDAGEAYVVFGGTFGGSTAAVTQAGTTAADILVGGAGNDSLTGNGGADALSGGAGNDRLSVGDLSFRSVDGGGGTDTLALGGAGLTLDLTAPLVGARIAGIERIDLAGTGHNTLRLDRAAVLREAEGQSDGRQVLTVEGDAGDRVAFRDSGWSKVGALTEGALTFDRYVNGIAEVRVERGLDVGLPQTINLATLAPSQGVVLRGFAGSYAGVGVSTAGDVNGDGFADVVIGNWGSPYLFVILGHSTLNGSIDGAGRSVINLAGLSPSQGYMLTDVTGGWHDASTAGDVNGDGYADLILGSRAADRAYIVYGKEGGTGSLSLGNLGASGMTIFGMEGGSNAGYAVSDAGDVNGDGFADVIVGVPLGDYGPFGSETDVGNAFVVFGGTALGSSIYLGNLSTPLGFVFQGDHAGDQAGYSVSAAGDVNGDGFGDIIVGAKGGDTYASDQGEAIVLYGKPTGTFAPVPSPAGPYSWIDATSLLASSGTMFAGPQSGGAAGYSVGSAGDVNGDGLSDIIIGAPATDLIAPDQGESYVVFGRLNGFGTNFVDLATLSSSAGFVVRGEVTPGQAGFSVSSAGDFNGDGFSDILIGAPYFSNPLGSAYLVFGNAAGYGSVVNGRSIVDLGNLGGDGIVIRGPTATGEIGRAGWSVSGAGDVNGDGFADVVIGAPDAGGNVGSAYIVFGGASIGASGPRSIDVTVGGVQGLVGGSGDDVLVRTGQSAIHAGAGNDTISTDTPNLFSLDGGGGTDTLQLQGAGQTFDFRGYANNRITSIEVIDLAGSGDNTVVLGAQDIFAMTEDGNLAFSAAHSHHAMVLEGDVGDSVSLPAYDPDGGGPVAGATWQKVAEDVTLSGGAGGAYDHYDLVRAGSGLVLASLAIDNDLLIL